MKLLASYASYEEAKECQLDLLAANIDARVEFAPADYAAVFTGNAVGEYGLLGRGERLRANSGDDIAQAR